MFSQLCDNIRNNLRTADSAHDWEHITRVLNTSIQLSIGHDIELTKIVAVMHEVGDPKLPFTETIREIMTKCGYTDEVISKIERIVPRISFTSSLNSNFLPLLPEEQAICDFVSDADKLDALGAIGIARTMAYSGSQGRPIYKMDDPPRMKYTAEEYKATGGSTTAVNHFFEKLFRLKDHMKTLPGKLEACKRIKFMRMYLDVFAEETGLKVEC